MNRVKTVKKNISALSVMIVFMLALIAMARTGAYAASKPIKITVSQIFSASSAPSGDVFTYILKPLEPGAPMPAGGGARGYTFSMAGNGSVEIGPLTYNRQGVYRYELYQEIESAKTGYTYDRRKYKLEAYVDSDLGVALVAFVDTDKKANQIVFENSYKAAASDSKLMTDTLVRKTVTGDPETNSTFNFKLAAKSSSNPMPAGSVNGIKSISITGSGHGSFGAWSYNSAGVYYYSVYEENTGVKGYTYDTTVYTITDIVTEENGKLVLSRVLTDELNKRAASLDFENKYNTIGTVLGVGNITPGKANNTSNIIDDGNPRGSATFTNAADGDVPGGAPGSQTADGGTPPANSSRQGVGGPKTGDNANTVLFIMLTAMGGVLAAGASAFLIINGKKKKAGQQLKNYKLEK